MKETFHPKGFNDTACKLLAEITVILDDYAEQGYDLSLRQLYYQLVSRNLVENTERSYKNIGVLVSDARMAGIIDWDMIKDRGREMVKNPHWDNPLDFIENVAPQYRFNLWQDQESYVEVMVEKQALEGVLEPVCRSLDVPFTANKGYSSSSAMYEAGKRMGKASANDKQVYVIYLGDHDPSGIDMSRDVLDRLNLFSGLAETVDADGRDVTVKRIALNMDQIEDLQPPENPAKLTDSRAAEYVKRFGRSSWELDAIEPKSLAGLVRDAIKSVMDVPLFNSNVKKMDKARKNLLKFAKTYLAE